MPFEQRPFDPYRDDPYAMVELANNTEQRCPCVLVLDCSWSMQGRCINDVNQAISRFADDLRADDLASKRVDIAVVTFGAGVQVIHDFTSARLFQPLQLEADGATPLGEAMSQAVQLIENRKMSMKEAGVPYYRPWIVLMTDGTPTDCNTHHWKRACDATTNGVKSNKFIFFPLITEGGDKETIRELSPVSEVRGLDSHKFSEFFLWLSGTLREVAKTPLGGQAVLTSPGTWIIDV